METNETTKVGYPEFVAAICKPGSEIVASLKPEDAHLIHMLLGLAGEVGELIDAVKKASVYQKTLDMENVIEELGDIEFYLQGVRNRFGLDRNSIVLGNFKKLSKRYSSGSYSNDQAINRADKSIPTHNG